MINLIVVFLSGLIFGLGLIVAGLANPAKVLSFLDVAGAWDPSLALVMCSAIVVAWFGFRQVAKMKVSYSGLPIQVPTKTRVDTRLILGSIIFGIGWGLAGICPGPGMVLLGTGMAHKAIHFIGAMIVGILLCRYMSGGSGQ